MNLPPFNIAAVERDTGLSKDVLRMWERRYGFPTPERDANGERLYPHDQVERLRLVKRLMDQGHRPGKLMGLASEELAALARRAPAPRESSSAAVDEKLDELLELIRRHDSVGYLLAMQQRLGRQGLQRFVQDTLAPLTHEVGKAWEDGRIEVFEEHLFTELTTRLLRQAIGALPAGSRPRPRVILTSVPEEQHELGLLMVESLLALEGAECVPQGTQMPVLEIVHAAEAHRIDVIALSFSIAFPQRQISGLLRHLRQLLPGHVALWAGGEGIKRATPLEGVDYLPLLADAAEATAAWRKAHP
ncbi:MAG TPA: MerR family transcriptional regulator [Aromatoleum sp.]|uniref:MerR family transcriptional regulator n=1 Tax=Aromatoleum sp. TaxID=2307007 RepID=UPI002B48E5FB|nr:MerR family transcriptional regulator [Aromatoleum sp.]HJV25142.1 MerR family transcriptional regulator [Aromatoleum sp.]